MRNKNSVTIKQALDSMVADLKLKPKLDETRIKDAWLRVMGKTVAKYTSKISLHQGKLYVQVSSPALKNELTYSKDKIIEVFNRELDDNVIKEVVVF